MKCVSRGLACYSISYYALTVSTKGISYHALVVSAKAISYHALAVSSISYHALAVSAEAWRSILYLVMPWQSAEAWHAFNFGRRFLILDVVIFNFELFSAAWAQFKSQ